VAVDAEHVYWANGGGDTIGRSNVDGTGLENQFISGANWPCGVEVDGAYLYWGNSNAAAAEDAPSLGRANLDGSGVDQTFVTGMEGICGVAVEA
jgi:hypothetical protein